MLARVGKYTMTIGRCHVDNAVSKLKCDPWWGRKKKLSSLISETLEAKFACQMQTVLFKCAWVNIFESKCEKKTFTMLDGHIDKGECE